MKAWILGIALLASGTTMAQKRNWKSDKKWDDNLSMTTLGIGVGFQEFDGLNSRVANLPQYRSLRDYTAVAHLGMMKESNRFITMSHLTAGSSMSGDRNRQSSTVRFIGIGADFGYDLIKDKRVMIYPLAGIGYDFYQAKFYRDNSNVDFDDVLGNPALQNSITPIAMTNSFLNYKLGMGVNLFSPADRGASIGLQAAYIGSFQNREWRAKEGQELANAPSDRLGRIQVSLILTHSANTWKKGGR